MLPNLSIHRREYKTMDLHGVTVVEAIPTMGLPAAIAGTHLVSSLDLRHVCGFESDLFPPISLVWDGKPRSPLRVYAAPERQLAVVACEFTPDPTLYRPIARAILDWARDVGAARILCPDGVAPLDDKYSTNKPRLVGAGTTRTIRDALKEAKIELLDKAMLSGVSAMLMTEAHPGMDVAMIGVEVSTEETERLHDVNAAAVLIDAVRKLHPGCGIKADKLREQAQEAEDLLLDLRERAQKAARQEDKHSYAYR